MVSLNPNLQPQEFYKDPLKMGLPGFNSPLTPPTNTTTSTAITANTTALTSEDPNKKVRKPYTITKSRESWTEQEHDKFLEALQLFDRDWKKIEAFIGSKTVIQIRSHAQKYFLKVQKNGTSEHVPPPRPKRKAAHPYPQKAFKNGAIPSSPALLEPGCVLRPDSLPVPRNTVSSAALTSWTYNTVPPVSVPHEAKDDTGLRMPSMAHNCSYCCSNESNREIWPTDGTNVHEKGKYRKPMRVMPDFAQVYSFIGSVFDPNASGHLQKLKKMDPINVETVLLLMKNLSVNLASPEFEDHRRLILSYDIASKKAKFSSPFNNLHSDKLDRAILSV
ncbi:protein REVEILLE 3-like isoform X2 [Cornus florida]|uniref:protein REVEILLE 3-like isoform X2 n=1 Tax=Cornus florida TaxID=4283 RepID=UPI00289D7C7D|nr:protein REVEILLE 3-like isoform X2 [Cornus florida]